MHRREEVGVVGCDAFDPQSGAWYRASFPVEVIELAEGVEWSVVVRVPQKGRKLADVLRALGAMAEWAQERGRLIGMSCGMGSFVVRFDVDASFEAVASGALIAADRMVEALGKIPA